MPRKPKQKKTPELPTREAILEFVAEHSGKAGKRDIARAFGLSGGQKIALKRMLRELADEGLIESRRKHLHRPGDLPSVTVLAVEGIDDEGEPIGVPVEVGRGMGRRPAHRHRAGRQRRPPSRAGHRRPRARAADAGAGDRRLHRARHPAA